MERSFLVCTFIAAASMLYGATYTWNVDANGNWTTTTNWDPEGNPNSSADEAIFGSIITATKTVTLNASRTIGSIEFDNAFTYQINPSTTEILTLNSASGPSTISVLQGSHSIGAEILLENSNLSISQTSNGTFTLSGDIGGDQSISYNGAGTLVMSGTNTFTGGLSITTGTIRPSSDDSLGDTGASFSLSSATLLVPASSNLTLPDTRDIAISGSSTFNANGHNMTIEGIISGTGSLTKAGANSLTLSGVNTYQGGTILSAGTLFIDTDSNLGASSGSVTMGSGSALSIQADTSSSRSLILNGAATLDIDQTVTWSGVVSGTGELEKSGVGTLILTGTNTTSGGFAITAGTLQGNSNSLLGDIANDGTLIFNQTGSGTYAGEISGTGDMTIQGGGSLIFTGSSGMSGTTNLTDSTTLTVNGSLAYSDLTIELGSMVRGSGTIGPTSNEGTLYPGNSIGTITINGDLSFVAGSDLILDIAPTTNSALDVTGEATLTNGDLTVVPTSGFYGISREYTLVTAGTRSGTFDSFTLSNSAFSGTLGYTATTVTLALEVLRPFANFPYENFNEEQVGNNIDALLSGGYLSRTGDLANAIDALVGSSFHQINEALDQMHPAAMSAFAELQFELGGNLLSRFMKNPKLLCGCESPNRFWAEPYGHWYNRHQQGEEIGFQATTYGVAAGYDRNLSGGWSFGGGVAWNETDLKWDLERGYAYVEGAYASVYTDLILGNWYFGSSTYCGVDWYDTSRKISFATTDLQAESSSKAIDLGAQVRAAYFFGAPSCLLYPYGTIDYLYLKNGSYTEKGAGAFNLAVGDYQSSTLRSEAGFTLQVIDKNYRETLCISPLVTLGWVMEWPLARSDYHSHFDQEPLSFVSRGWNETFQLFNVRLGLGITYKCFDLSSLYSLEVASGKETPFKAQTANVRFAYRF